MRLDSVPFQPSLFDAPEVGFDRRYATLERVLLDEESWVDYAPGWVSGSDELFQQVVRGRDWGQRTRWMYEKKVLEPRLTAPWNLRSGTPLEPAILEDMRRALSDHGRSAGHRREDPADLGPCGAEGEERRPSDQPRVPLWHGSEGVRREEDGRADVTTVCDRACAPR